MSAVMVSMRLFGFVVSLAIMLALAGALFAAPAVLIGWWFGLPPLPCAVLGAGEVLRGT